MPSLRSSLSAFGRHISSIVRKKSTLKARKENKGTLPTAPPASTLAENSHMLFTQDIVCSLLSLTPPPPSPAPLQRPQPSSSTRSPRSPTVGLARTKASKPRPRADGPFPARPPRCPKREKVASRPAPARAPGLCVDLALPAAPTFTPLAAPAPAAAFDDATDAPLFTPFPRRRPSHRRSHSAWSVSSASSSSSSTSDRLRRKALQRATEVAKVDWLQRQMEACATEGLEAFLVKGSL
ncbi:hypothetical protein JCM10207_004237 [Rhodosporidiobolus poonsookiae]